MCESHILLLIEAIVETKMAIGELFTTFDVTLMLQRNGIYKYHREVRNDIKRYANNAIHRYGYQRTFVTLPGTDRQAFLYHPIGADLDNYLPSRQPLALPPAIQPGDLAVITATFKLNNS